MTMKIKEKPTQLHIIVKSGGAFVFHYHFASLILLKSKITHALSLFHAKCATFYWWKFVQQKPTDGEPNFLFLIDFGPATRTGT